MSRECAVALLALAAATTVQAACPAGGLESNGKCWFLGEVQKSCKDTCMSKGTTYSQFVPGEAAPMVPQLLGRNPQARQFAWARTECYVPGADRYHTAKAVAEGNSGDTKEPGDWSHEVCRLACPCAGEAPPPVDSSAPYPECVGSNAVYRHAGAHAIFLDLSSHGSSGCWQNDCKNTDKFNAEDQGICARTCSQVDECTHWTFGEQEGAKKCFFRKSDAGREFADGWYAAPKSCAPPALPHAFVALTAGNLLKACDGGKSDACPDMARAITTWKFAIKNLKKAADGVLDANTAQFVNQIQGDTDAFAAQMSEENFPVVVANNRQVMNALNAWMTNQPKAVINPNDASLPNPLRGRLCGPNSCYENI